MICVETGQSVVLPQSYFRGFGDIIKETDVAFVMSDVLGHLPFPVLL
jgi:hypothetical protein